MHTLSVAFEAYPLIKTGVLADLVGAISRALAPHGVATTTLLPGYPAVALESSPARGRWPAQPDGGGGIADVWEFALCIDLRPPQDGVPRARVTGLDNNRQSASTPPASGGPR